MAKSHDDFKDETDQKVREWHEKRAEEKGRPVGIMGLVGTPRPGAQPLSGSAASRGVCGLGDLRVTARAGGPFIGNVGRWPYRGGANPDTGGSLSALT